MTIAINGIVLTDLGFANDVYFANDRPFPTAANRLVLDPSGQPLVGTNYVAALYYGVNPTNLNPASPVILSRFRAPATSTPGTWSGGNRTLGGVAIGTTVFMKVKVWDNIAFPTGFEMARTNGGMHGESDVFSYTPGVGFSLSSNRWMHNFRGFALTACSDAPPTLNVQPTSQISLLGSDVTFRAGALGSCDFKYQWRFNGVDVPGATNSLFTLENGAPEDEGNYTVAVRTPSGTAISSPASLQLRSVVVFLNHQSAVAESYAFLNTVTLEIATTFTNGSIYYTLDGSDPNDGTGTLYKGRVRLQSSATIRATGYSSDGMRSESFGPVGVSVAPGYSLSIDYSPGGHVLIDPGFMLYPTGSTVLVKALPLTSTGWKFLGWAGDLSGQASAMTLDARSNISARAVFGTALFLSSSGGGSIEIRPPSTNVPYGAVVELLARPFSNRSFSHWATGGGSIIGTTNPLRLVALENFFTVSANFSAMASNNVTLLVRTSGAGQAFASPVSNQYVHGTTVALDAVPDSGGLFLGWGGDAGGTTSLINVHMDRSKSIDAMFTPMANLAVSPSAVAQPSPYVSFDIVGSIGDRYQIQESFGLPSWMPVATMSNQLGLVRFSKRANTNQNFFRAVILPP